jgi:hypothetical protein
MSYGKDERHIDKALWKLPIPLYDNVVAEHRRLAELGQACADHVGPAWEHGVDGESEGGTRRRAPHTR